jgi:DNA (cytosine-5)-methyltransferase 1
MTYLELLERELVIPRKKRGSKTIHVLDLFAGCGGLALGFEAAGFETLGYEMLADACQTYNQNLKGRCVQQTLEPDQDLIEHADVIIGGPPCQPFSVGGLQQGKKDKRDGFPAFLSAVERYQPDLALFENVRGMLFKNRAYFDQIALNLSDLGYIVEWKMLNAFDFGVPQKRERLFVVAHKGAFSFPKPLDCKGYTAGEALGELAFEVLPSTKFLTKSMDEYVAKYEKKSFCIRPRDLHLDQPSRTVTCRNLNGATGDMLRVRLPDGSRKRLSVREGARLQSFPDWFVFHGAEGSQFNQVGNAVPPLLAKAIAASVRQYMDSDFRLSKKEIAGAANSRQLTFEFGAE